MTIDHYQIDTRRALLLLVRWWMLRVLSPDPVQSEMKVFLIRKLEELLGGDEESIVGETKLLMGGRTQEQQLEFMQRMFNIIKVEGIQ